MWSYSSRALQFGAKAYSRPAPKTTPVKAPLAFETLGATLTLALENANPPWATPILP
jgi:hypothetical protein